MNITDNIKESMHYAISDYKKLLIFGVIILLSEISFVFTTIGISLQQVDSIIVIIEFICAVLVQGYILSIIKDSLDKNDVLPDFNLKNDFVMGIKSFVLGIVYAIVPLVLVIITFTLTGGADAIGNIINHMNVPANATAEMVSAAFSQQFNFFGTPSFVITAIVSLILLIVFLLFYNVSFARLAKTGSLADACNFVTSFKEIGKIGWGHYVLWYIAIEVLAFIILIVEGIVCLIPIAGVLISGIVIDSFVKIFTNRSLGSIYLEIED